MQGLQVYNFKESLELRKVALNCFLVSVFLKLMMHQWVAKGDHFSVSVFIKKSMMRKVHDLDNTLSVFHFTWVILFLGRFCIGCRIWAVGVKEQIIYITFILHVYYIDNMSVYLKYTFWR